ncbi:hypothetical protein PENFLA_c014G08069 [Penicillium flavigenum]|uniref:Uncharacterized protein n=1 Tax=Penicillium flavigenum TaxID=254877 RepID=A0A1V6T6H4_9EURO|nr:hypothetical protein PENFLA_c014G08069 [Penicillium flavigenum]
MGAMGQNIHTFPTAISALVGLAMAHGAQAPHSDE